MKYRQFGKLDWQPSALGFGCMRFPVVGDDNAVINEELAAPMLRRAIEAGVNYIDTAWPYHREQSESFVGKVLSEGYRGKVRLATKMPSWLVNTREDLDRFLDIQLERLQTDYIDFYLLHTLNARSWENYRRLNVFEWAERKMAEGKFHYLGFSFHDTYEVFEDILNGYDNWTFCQIQYNYMDVNYQAGQKGLRAAANKGLAVVVMEPLRGGRLAKNPPPPSVAEVFARSGRDWTPANWALQWVWNQPEVSLLLSGMSTMEQVEQNLVSADQSNPGSLKPEDLAVIEQARQAREALAPIPCTHCEYCLPCPSGVAIPSVFEIYNEAVMYEEPGRGQSAYKYDIQDENKADRCVECGTCESLCPQQIEIISWLKKAHAYLTPSGS
ncbi:MAG: aldo/keto reductase [Chloroflexi bacterium]|jgi:predicted aldo/keto reductase-like oxidoreductase|nr:aldo/keto reductase [Anaerolineaceae bacterium]NLI43925.1 aldo/keto reductase [Chloroflexota bacterium]HOE35191.1 aldo/keto reductase [Anaerolineaceae bacterium]HOT26119.1 aldo/keto reductase [Anaerolineaceae bacterium]HQH58341.1 aldo/keto reductase [Anaerolineaceae bacterium]